MSLYPPPAPSSERAKIPDMIGQLFGELSNLVQQHVELAKTELRAEAGVLAKAGIFLAAAALLGVVGLVILAALSVVLWDNVVSLEAAVAITLGEFLLLAGIFATLTIKELKTAQDLLKQGMPPKRY